MSTNAFIAAIMLFMLLISGCTDKNTSILNQSPNTIKNNTIIPINDTNTPEQPENSSISNENDLSINIVLEKPPKEVIGGE